VVQWLPSNKGAVLERLREVIGGTLRPGGFFWYTGVMPTYDIGQLGVGGTRKVLYGTATAPTAGNNDFLISALTNFVNGMKYRVLGVVATVSTLGTSITLSCVGVLQGGSFILAGQPNTAGAAGFGFQAIGGPLANGVEVGGNDNYRLRVAAVNNTANNVITFELDCIEENLV